jgi:CRISPR-associated protein Cmr4
MSAIPAFIHLMTPLHAGTGQGAGAIDQPIARERATQLPVLPGSSIKGVLRDAFEGDPEQHTLFGPPSGNASDFGGALQCSDARLLLLPVRSLASTFVWTTCPFVLRRLTRDLKAIFEHAPKGLPSIPEIAEDSWAAADKSCAISLNGRQHLVLEDLNAPVQVDNVNAKAWAQWIGALLFTGADSAWQKEMEQRFAIVDDASFTYLAENATEVAAHIEINDETGTVAEHKLWYQESLPAETVLTCIVRATRPWNGKSSLKDATQVLRKLKPFSSIQFGGKATTGQGFARFLLFGEDWRKEKSA